MLWIELKRHWNPCRRDINLPSMKHIVLLTVLLGVCFPQALLGIDNTEKCSGVQRAESFREMDRDELGAHRKRVADQMPSSVVEAICESTSAITYAA